MRNFASLRNEPGLRKFSDSPLGTLYMLLDARGYPLAMLRHFDSLVPPSLVGAYAAMIELASQWIEARPELGSLVEVERLSEVGNDFVARRFHVYGPALNAYADVEDPPEIPDELAAMQTAFRAALSRSLEPHNRLIETVLVRSLLEPTGKTYFDEPRRRFVVVELKLHPEDLSRWSNLAQPG